MRRAAPQELAVVTSPARQSEAEKPETSPARRAYDSIYESITERVALLVTGLILGILGLVVGAVVTADGARKTGELRLDVWLSQHRDGALRGIGDFVQVVFGPMIAPLILIVVCGFLWWRRDRVGAVLVVLLAIPGWFSVEVGKILFSRARPPAGVVHALVHETKPDSFPSGHVAFAAALVAALAVVFHRQPRVRTWIYAIGVPLVVIVAACRLIVGAHYLGDVVASPLFAVGTILVLTVLGAGLPSVLEARLGSRPDHLV